MREKQTQILDIPFPETAELERMVLADAVAAPEALGDIIPMIHPDFFTTTQRRDIWELIVSQYNAGKDTDVWTIGSLVGKPFADEVAPRLSEAGTATGPTAHAQLLRAGAARRRAYFAATVFLQGAMQPGASEQDILTSVEMFSRTVDGPQPLQTEAPLPEVIQQVRESAKLEEKAAAQGESIRIATGFHYIDGVINGGMRPGQLVILAARPSVGKTALMLNIAKNAAVAGYPVQLFSLEMTAEELGERLIFSTGMVRPSQLNHGRTNWEDFDQAEAQLTPLPIYVNEFSKSLDEIVSRLNQNVKAGRCKIAFIDYLSLISDCVDAPSGGVKLYQVITRVTGTLKRVAKRLHIPIVLLCQMNRDQVREKRAPELYDLRDSGSIEQDADIVLMLEPKPDEGRIYAWLRKNRNGKRDVGFVFVPNDTYSSFEEGVPVTELAAPEETTAPPAVDIIPGAQEANNYLPF